MEIDSANIILTAASGTIMYQADCGMGHAVNERVEKCMQMLKDCGKKPYLIPEGGLDKAGIWV